MKIISCLFALLISFIGCSNTVKGDDISIIRFDKDLYSYLQSTDKSSQKNLQATHPQLLQAFGQVTIGKMIMQDTAQFFTAMEQYFAHPMLSQIYRDELSTFSDLTTLESHLGQAKAFVSAHFPDSKFPQLAMHVSGFKENVIVLDGFISLSGDKYMGKDYKGYQGFFSPKEREQMEMRFIARDYLKAWILSDKIVEREDEPELLAAIIEEGKILYLLSKLLPESSKEDLIGYTITEMAWCNDNDKMVWQTITKQNHLFSKDRLLISQYITDAPYTTPISVESPSKVGSWIGWQIVEQYAKKSGLSVQDVLAKDARTILKDSKYKP